MGRFVKSYSKKEKLDIKKKSPPCGGQNAKKYTAPWPEHMHVSTEYKNAPHSLIKIGPF